MEISSFFFSLSFLEGAVVLKNRDGKRGIKKEILFIAVCCDEVRKKNHHHSHLCTAPSSRLLTDSLAKYSPVTPPRWSNARRTGIRAPSSAVLGGRVPRRDTSPPMSVSIQPGQQQLIRTCESGYSVRCCWERMRVAARRRALLTL